MTEKLLPDYVVHVDGVPTPEVLRKAAEPFSFPLSPNELAEIETLVAKYESEENIAGLAAPQIGISKRAIIFEVSDDPELKKWRQDLDDTMPRSIWLNPEYKGIEDRGFTMDYEGCFSVSDVAGLVRRYTAVEYTAFDMDGNLIKGEATGFLARAIQHEIDHLNGILYIDKATEILPIDEYRKRRQESMAG